MKECNNIVVAKKIYKLFGDKLNEFKFVGLRKWGDPAGIINSDTYEIKCNNRSLYCTQVEWGQSGTMEPNRCGILISLPTFNVKESLGQITDIVIPYEFSRRFNCRAYEDNGRIELRSYGKYTIGRRSLKKDDFFDYIHKTNSAPLCIDEEGIRYVSIMYIDNYTIAKEEFAKATIDFAFLIKGFKDIYRDSNFSFCQGC